MVNELVGYENLPNAYIKEIKLTEYNQDSFEMVVTVTVKDFLDGNQYVWSSDEFMSPMVKVGLICATDDNVAGSLTAGISNPFTKEVLKLRKTRSAINKKFDGPSVEFVHTFNHIYPKNISNLTIFSFCFIEEIGIRTYGPMKSEKVIENSNVNGKTFVFRKPDGSLWSGPVHERDDKYMVGSNHSGDSHTILTREAIGNFKIRNFIENKPKNSVFRKDKSGAFSDLYMCMDNDTNIKGIFYMNIENIFINNSKYSRFMASAPTVVVHELLERFKIKSLKINRKRFKESRVLMEDINIINTRDQNGKIKNFTRVRKNNVLDVVAAELPSSTTPDPNLIYKEDLTRENIISEVREIFMDNNYKIRRFQFADKSLFYNTSGIFEYNVSVTFEDPTYAFLKESYVAMTRDISNCKQYLSFKSRNKNYDFKEDRLKVQFRSYDQVNLKEIAENYAKFYFYVFEGDARNRLRLKNKSYSLLSPSSSTLHDSRVFLERYEQLYKAFARYLDDNDMLYQNTTGRFNVKNNSRINIFTVNYDFNEEIIPSKNRYRINYLNNETTNDFKVYTKREFSARIANETRKFFSHNPNFIIGQYGSLEYSKLQGLNNITSNSTQYLSPVSVVSLDAMSSHERIEYINNQTLNNTIEDKIFSTISNNLHIQSYGQQNSQTQTTFIPVSNILNSSSAQSYYTGDDTEETVSEDLISQVSYGSANTNLNSRDLYKKDFNITNNDFPMYNIETAALPMQIKALLGSNLSTTNNSILAAEVDAIADLRTRNSINLNFLSPQSVEYIKGYIHGADGFVSLKGPNWQPLTLQELDRSRSPILCRMRRYSNQSLKIDVEIERVFNVVDEYFIISNKDINTKELVTIPDSSIYEFEDWATYEYTNSNIVTQTNEEFFFYKVPMGIESTFGDY